MSPTPPRAILIAGPTASGKSALASALAVRRDGVVINADSMQVYRELRILTARPTPAEEARAPHGLYGHVPAAEPYSTGRWLAEIKAVLAAARRDGWLPVIVGGTGLYFKALTEGLAPVPEIPAAVRAHWRVEAARLGSAALHDLLAVRDPALAARLDPTDTQRITRALEVIEGTGRSLLDWQKERTPPLLPPEVTDRLVVVPDRATLYAHCDARFDAMMAAGAADEVAALTALGLDPALPVMGALGVRQIADWLAGRTSREEAVASAKQATRNYAKRQLTWLRHQMPGWRVVTPEIAREMIGAKVH